MDGVERYDEGLIYGRNAVLEALAAKENIDCVYISAKAHNGGPQKIIALAKSMGVPVKDVSPQKLDAMAGGQAHQGVCAVLACVKYADMDEVYSLAAKRGDPLFLVVADGIEDPHNLGAIIRTAECCGAHGVVIPKRRSAGLSPAVYKSSAGAASHLPVVRVANLPNFAEKLKKEGVWFFCADMEGQTWCQADFSGPLALVVGSEGNGVGRLMKEKCDFAVSLPLLGAINSLNASVAAGVIMYEIARQRLAIQAK